jgi:hypothetical protein
MAFFLVCSSLHMIIISSRISLHSPIPKDSDSGGKSYTAICVIIKNELRYIDEWVDYHMLIGFSKIFVYDNSDDHGSTIRWRNSRKDRDRLQIFKVEGERQQMNSYKKCAKEAKYQNVSWLLFSDIDEFVLLKKHARVDYFVNEYGKFGQILLQWRVFGTMGKILYSSEPVLSRFQCRVSDEHPQNSFTKSLIHLDELDLSRLFRDPHIFPMKRMRNIRRKYRRSRIMNVCLCDPKIAVLNHYYYRSYNEFLDKRKRGDVFYGGNGTFLLNESLQGIDVFTGRKIPNGSVFDPMIWQKYVSLNPNLLSFNSLHRKNPCAEFESENVTIQSNYTGINHILRRFRKLKTAA